MSEPVNFEGANKTLVGPRDRDDIAPLPIFTNGLHCVSCWKLSEAELAEIQRTGRVYVSIFSGATQPAVYVSGEAGVRELIADRGVWKR